VFSIGLISNAMQHNIRTSVDIIYARPGVLKKKNFYRLFSGGNAKR